MHSTATPTFTRGAIGGVRATLRLEGALVLLACMLAYQATGAGWRWFAGAFFLLDLSMIAYAGGAAIGARVYNAAHSYAGPLLLAALALQGRDESWIVPTTLVWAAHIGFDRMLGYGLKYETAFADTHLGRIGRISRAASTNRVPTTKEER